jgi:hypothetical protein
MNQYLFDGPGRKQALEAVVYGKRWDGIVLSLSGRLPDEWARLKEELEGHDDALKVHGEASQLLRLKTITVANYDN